MNQVEDTKSLQKTVAELRALNLPKASCEDVGIIAGRDAAFSSLPAINLYLSCFVSPKYGTSGAIECPQCGAQVSGLLGTFRWGIVHGEGHCGRCMYPAQAYHSIKDDYGNEIWNLSNYILMAHPNGLLDYTAMEPMI